MFKFSKFARSFVVFLLVAFASGCATNPVAPAASKTPPASKTPVADKTLAAGDRETPPTVRPLMGDPNASPAPSIEQWRRIRDGMTKAEVRSILGVPWQAAHLTWVYLGDGYVNYTPEGTVLGVGGVKRN